MEEDNDDMQEDALERFAEARQAQARTTAMTPAPNDNRVDRGGAAASTGASSSRPLVKPRRARMRKRRKDDTGGAAMADEQKVMDAVRDTNLGMEDDDDGFYKKCVMDVSKLFGAHNFGRLSELVRASDDAATGGGVASSSTTSAAAAAAAAGAASTAEQKQADPPEPFNLIKELLSRESDLNEGMVYLDALKKASVPDWYESAEENSALTKQLLEETDPVKSKALFDRLMSRCAQMPQFGVAALSRQMTQSGRFWVCIDRQKQHFATRDFPPCSRGEQCHCMSANIARGVDTPRRPPIVGTAMMTLEEADKFWAGDYMPVRRPCHLCYWVARTKLAIVMRNNVFKVPPGQCQQLLAIAARQLYSVKIECEDGFDEQFVLKPGQPAMAGQYISIPDQAGDYTEAYQNLCERAGSARLPVPLANADPYPLGYLPCVFVDALEWRCDRASGQWYLDLSRCAWKPSEMQRRRDADEDDTPSGGSGGSSSGGGSRVDHKHAPSSTAATHHQQQQQQQPSGGGGGSRRNGDVASDDNKSASREAHGSAWRTAHATAMVDRYTSAPALTSGNDFPWKEKARQSHTKDRVIKRIQTAWMRQCTMSRPTHFLHLVSEYVSYTLSPSTCAYFSLLAWTLPQPVEFTQLIDAERIVGQMRQRLLPYVTDVEESVPYRHLHALYGRSIKPLLRKRLFHNTEAWNNAYILPGFSGFVRWCALVRVYEEARQATQPPPPHELLEALLFVIDGQWLDVFAFIEHAIGVRASQTPHGDPWCYTMGGRWPFFSNPVLHYSELPYPTFMINAFLRHGDSDSVFEYLFNKVSPRAAGFRSLRVKGPEAMMPRPYVARYMRALLLSAMLFGVNATSFITDAEVTAGEDKQQATASSQQQQQPRRRASASSARTAAKSTTTATAAMTEKQRQKQIMTENVAKIAAACRGMQPVHQDPRLSTLHSDIALRGVMYRLWFSRDTEPSSSTEWRHTLLEHTMEANQFITLQSMQCLLVYCWHVDVAFRECVAWLFDAKKFVAELVVDVGLSQQWIAPLWVLMEGDRHGARLGRERRVFAEIILARCRDASLREYVKQNVWAACLHSNKKAVAVALRTLTYVCEHMAQTIRDRVRIRYPETSLHDMLIDRFAATQTQSIRIADMSSTPVHEKLGLTTTQLESIETLIANCATKYQQDSLLVRVLIEVFGWTNEKLALLLAIIRTHHTVRPVEDGMQKLATHESELFKHARAVALLIRRKQMYSSLPLPAHVVDAQLKAVRKRFNRMHCAIAEDTVVLEGCMIWYCPVCQKTGTYVRHNFRDTIERELNPKYDALSLLDCIVMSRESGKLRSSYLRVLPDRGNDAMCISLPSGHFCCEGCQTFRAGEVCDKTPMRPLFLLGRLVRCDTNEWLGICPQPDCGVPSIISLVTVWNEHYFACSRCTLRMTKDSHMFQHELKVPCQLCDRKISSSRAIEWKPYGWTVCDTHHDDLESILEFVDVLDREQGDLDSLKQAYKAWQRARVEHKAIQRTASLLSDVVMTPS
jgi:hypothetical protein